MTVTVSIPNGTLDGPDCIPLPITTTFNKMGDPTKVSATVTFTYAQRASGESTTKSVSVPTGASSTGSISSQLDLCASQFIGQANLVKNTVAVQATDGLSSFSAYSKANFFVAKAPTTIRAFQMKRTSVTGMVQVDSQRFGPIGAAGSAIVWFRPPGQKRFTRLGISKLDESGRFTLPTRGRVPANSLLKVSSYGCTWCKEAHAETRAPAKEHTPDKPKPVEKPTTASKTKYFSKPSWYTYVALRFDDEKRKVRAVWQGDGPGFCFVGRLTSQDTYTGTQYTFGVGKKATSYTRGELFDGRRVSPPTWFRQSSKQAFDKEQCR